MNNVCSGRVLTYVNATAMMTSTKEPELERSIIMANAKTVCIEGTIPFHTAEDERVTRWLGILNGPSYGLRINYIGAPVLARNGHGGRTARYRFSITGTEAIARSALDDLIDAFMSFGAVVNVATVADLDGGASYSLIPEAWR